jgi:hypothetical protein
VMFFSRLIVQTGRLSQQMLARARSKTRGG